MIKEIALAYKQKVIQYNIPYYVKQLVQLSSR